MEDMSHGNFEQFILPSFKSKEDWKVCFPICCSDGLKEGEGYLGES